MFTQENKIIGSRFFGVTIVSLVAVLLLGATVVLAATLSDDTNVSGRETSIGYDCEVNGQPATCGVRFRGWCGGGGQTPGGWVPFPGTGECSALVKNVKYRDISDNEAKILSGEWRIVKIENTGKLTLYSGKVKKGGTILWPGATGYDPGICGEVVAVVTAPLSGEYKCFKGCLDDIAPPIIPQIWGTFTPEKCP